MFRFPWQKAHPVQHPIVGTVVAVVLDVVPRAEGNLKEFVADLLRVVDGILLAPQLDPLSVATP